ncbi:MAG TPA: AtpZ/AtpI family protein [Polyangiaceae bacterium]
MAKPYKQLGRYGTVGLDLVVSILLLGWVGHWLDVRYWGGHDWGMLAGGFLGLVVGTRNLIKAALRMQKDIEADEARDPEGSRWTVDETWLHPHDEPYRPSKPDDDSRPN